jgi:hypothetical protein
MLESSRGIIADVDETASQEDKRQGISFMISLAFSASYLIEATWATD